MSDNRQQCLAFVEEVDLEDQLAEELSPRSRYLKKRYILESAIVSGDVSLADMKSYFRRPNSKVVCLFEFGIRFRRLDLIQVDSFKRVIKAYEFKVSRGDFTRDTKWGAYLKFCHSLTFVCPYGLIDRSELPGNVGLLYIVKWKHNDGEVWRKMAGGPKWIVDGGWVRKPRRHKMDPEMYMEVISMLLNRAKHRQGEFF